MAERRSIGDALEALPDEKLRFIDGNSALPKGAMESQVANEAMQVNESSEEETTQSRRSSGRQSRKRPTATMEVPDSWKVPVTIKLQYTTAQALRRAYLEQKLNHASPNTQQEIVELAVGNWLRQNGYLTKGEDSAW